jgi:hypothetical protein
MKGPPESPFNEHVIALAKPEMEFWAVNRQNENNGKFA